MSRKVITVALLLQVIIVVAAYCLDLYSRRPYECRQFDQHRSAFQAQITAIGMIGDKKNKGQRAVPTELDELGVHSIENEGNYVVFVFKGMPIDSSKALVYSPRGNDETPVFVSIRNPGLHLIRFIKIDREWFFCEYDS